MHVILCGVSEGAIRLADSGDQCECNGPPVYGDGQRFYCEECVPPPLRRAIALWMRSVVAARLGGDGSQGFAESN